MSPGLGARHGRLLLLSSGNTSVHGCMQHVAPCITAGGAGVGTIGARVPLTLDMGGEARGGPASAGGDIPGTWGLMRTDRRASPQQTALKTAVIPLCFFDFSLFCCGWGARSSPSPAWQWGSLWGLGAVDAGSPPKPQLPSSPEGFLLHCAHLRAVVAVRAWGGGWHCCHKGPAQGRAGVLLPAGGLLGGSAHPLEVQQCWEAMEKVGGVTGWEENFVLILISQCFGVGFFPCLASCFTCLLSSAQVWCPPADRVWFVFAAG